MSRISAYGLQRETVLRAERDNEGFLRAPYNLPVYDYWTIQGDVDTGVLLSAVKSVMAGVDVLRGRLRVEEAGPCFIEEDGAAGFPVVFADLTGCADGVRRERLGHILFQSWSGIRDLRHGPLACAVVVRLAEDQHVLSLAFDHSVSDHTTAVAVAKRIGRAYGCLRLGDHDGAKGASASPSFLAHARSVEADLPGRRRVDAFWSAAVPEISEFAFPGGRWLPWRERRVTERVSRRLSPTELRALRTAGTRFGTSINQVYLAAITLVLRGVAEADFVPVTYNRSGRLDHEQGLPGPLSEMTLTRDPGEPDVALGDWVRRFVLVNAGTPFLRGAALVDFADLDRVMESRRVTLNVLHPSLPFTFGPHRAVPLPDSEVVEPIDHRVRGIAHNVGIRIVAEPGTVVMSCQYDPRDLPDGEAFMDAVGHAVLLIGEKPETSTTRSTAAVAETAE